MGWRIFILSFDQLIQQINENNREQRDRGTAFEYLVQTYLKHEPLYKNMYSDVWMLSEVPESESIPKKDTGVDLVAKNLQVNWLLFKPSSMIIASKNLILIHIWVS